MDRNHRLFLFGMTCIVIASLFALADCIQQNGEPPMDNIMMIELTPEQAKQMVDGGLSGFIIPHDDKIEWEDGSVSLLHAQRPDAP